MLDNKLGNPIIVDHAGISHLMPSELGDNFAGRAGAYDMAAGADIASVGVNFTPEHRFR